MISRKSSLPLYHQIKRDIESMIQSGKCAPDVALPSETSLAKDYHVSVMTVRQAFSELVNEGKLYRIPGKGTFIVDKTNKKVKDIGFVFRDTAQIEHPFFSGLIQGIKTELAERGNEHNLFISTFKDDIFYRNLVQEGKVDGLIITGQEMDERDVYRWQEYGIPFILLFYPYHIDGVSRIYVDFEGGTYNLTKHLIDRGYTSVGMLHGPWEWEIERQKVRGYRRALRDLGNSNVITLETIYDSEKAYEAALKLIRSTPELTSIVCADDLLAVSCIKAAAECGLNVPRDLAVVGFGDFQIASLFTPSITTMRIPLADIGAQGCRLLINDIESRVSSPCDIKIEPILIERTSTGKGQILAG